MKIEQAIYNLHRGDLLYFKNHGFFHAVVRFFMRWKYDHVAVYAGNNEYIESTRKDGIKRSSFSDQLPNAFQHTHTQFKYITLQAINQKLGTKYSYLDGFWAWAFRKTLSPGFMCSELAIYYLELEGWNWKGQVVTPYRLSVGVQDATKELYPPLGSPVVEINDAPDPL